MDQVTKEMTIATETEQLKAQFAMTPGAGGPQQSQGAAKRNPTAFE